VKEKELDFEFSLMNSFERRLVHKEVGKAGLSSCSTDEGENRRVIITLKK
jgi:spoIIIJ-associated protein